jgi:hypothetical protein
MTVDRLHAKRATGNTAGHLMRHRAYTDAVLSFLMRR